MTRNATGEGSVYQRKDGRWVAAAYVPVVGGKVRRQAVYAKSRAEAGKRLQTGTVQTYALFIVLGLLAILAYFVGLR